VRHSARELGYRPNVAAQALRLGSSRAVALLVPDVTNPFFSRVLRGAQRAAAAAGYTVALVDTANDRRWQEQSFEALRAGPVDGYLLFEVDAPEALGTDVAVVIMEAEAPGPLLATVADVKAAIEDLDGVAARYRDAYTRFAERFCHLDDGHASERVADALLRAG